MSKRHSFDVTFKDDMINVSHLVKHFGALTAVDDVSFQVSKGEVLGFLGPNGAGKSTTMRMLTCFIPPSSGTATIGGFDILNDSINARRQLGYLPENAPVYYDMTVEGYLGFIAEMRGCRGADKTKKIENAIEMCALKNVRHQVIDTLSKGYKQRTCFAQAILHDPPVLVLDEPTDGLDPNQKHEMRQMIKRMSENKCIILSTHILEEVDAVCSRAIIIAKGKVLANGTPAELKARSQKHGTVVMRLKNVEEKEAIPYFGNVLNVYHVAAQKIDNSLEIKVQPVQGKTIIADVAAALRQKNWNIEQLNVEEGRLDEVFRIITKA